MIDNDIAQFAKFISGESTDTHPFCFGGKSIVDPLFADVFKTWAGQNSVVLTENVSLKEIRSGLRLFYEFKLGNKQDAFEHAESFTDSEIDSLKKNIFPAKYLTEDSQQEETPQIDDDGKSKTMNPDDTDADETKEEKEEDDDDDDEEKPEEDNQHSVAEYALELKTYLDQPLSKKVKINTGIMEKVKKFINSPPVPQVPSGVTQPAMLKTLKQENETKLAIIDIIMPLVSAENNNENIRELIEEFLTSGTYNPPPTITQNSDVEIFEGVKNMKNSDLGILIESTNIEKQLARDGWKYISSGRNNELMPISKLRKDMPKHLKVSYNAEKGQIVFINSQGTPVRSLKLYHVPESTPNKYGVSREMDVVTESTKTDPVTQESQKRINAALKAMVKNSSLSPKELDDVVSFADEVGLSNKASMNALVKSAESAMKAKKGSKEEYAKDALLMATLNAKEDKATVKKFYDALKGTKGTEIPEEAKAVEPEIEENPSVTEVDVAKKLEKTPTEKTKNVGTHDKIKGQPRGGDALGTIDENCKKKIHEFLTLKETKVMQFEDGKTMKLKPHDMKLIREFIESSPKEKQDSLKLSLIDSYDGFSHVYNKAFLAGVNEE